MYRCEGCNKPKLGKPHKVVTETRRKIYPSGSVGYETVSEKLLCLRCARWELSKNKQRT